MAHVRKSINEMQVGEKIEGFFLLSSPEIKSTSSGSDFLIATLSDKTGNISMKKWDYKPEEDGKFEDGTIIKLRAEVSEYKGTKQLIASLMRTATDEDGYDLGKILPVAPINIEEYNSYIAASIANIKAKDIKDFCIDVYNKFCDAFKTIPAAKAMHHAFIGGWLMHTGNMMKLAESIAAVYGEAVNKDLLIAGTFLHDIGKLEEYDLTKYGLVKEYSVRGSLIGHLALGAMLVDRSPKLTPVNKTLLEHMLLSHHGNPEWGAAVKPMCIEAELLSLIDLMDSRAEMYTEVARELPETPGVDYGFTPKAHLGLGKKVLVKVRK